MVVKIFVQILQNQEIISKLWFIQTIYQEIAPIHSQVIDEQPLNIIFKQKFPIFLSISFV